MKKLFLFPFILITILSCNNDCNNEILEKAESNEILSSKVTSSIATESYLSKYLLLECGGCHATSRNQDDFYESLIDDYNLSTQQVIVSNKWSTGFGMVNPVAGIACSICFMIMSEALC